MKLEINIPTDLSEIKLFQYQKFLEIAKNKQTQMIINEVNNNFDKLIYKFNKSFILKYIIKKD